MEMSTTQNFFFLNIPPEIRPATPPPNGGRIDDIIIRPNFGTNVRRAFLVLRAYFHRKWTYVEKI